MNLQNVKESKQCKVTEERKHHDQNSVSVQEYVPGVSPGTYNLTKVKGPSHNPVIVQCFFKGADKCSVCEELLYGDYYKEDVMKKRRPLSWCLQCFRFALPSFTSTYRASLRKHRHCRFAHKHIEVKDIVYHLVPRSRIRALSLKEKIMWGKFGEIKDSNGLPV